MSTRIVLDEFFARQWADRDPFEAAAELDGLEFRAVKSRRTFRFELEGRGYFIKYHRGVGWREIFKNLMQLKAPVLGADNEFNALSVLNQLEVPTMHAAAFGSRGWNPARRESFLITDELCNMRSLEDVVRDWPEHPPAFSRKRAIIAALAASAGTMHRAGINHRDCYICHYLLDDSGPLLRLHVIDLHRAQLRRRVPRRYLVKDLGGLCFSSFDAGITMRDRLRFIRDYTGRPLREELSGTGRKFWRDVWKNAVALYIKEFGRPPQAAASSGRGKRC